MATSPCSICELVAGRITTPGGPIHDDGLWLVTHHTGPHTDPGELIVQLRRLASNLHELAAREHAAAEGDSDVPSPAEIDEAVLEVRGMLDQLRSRIA